MSKHSNPTSTVAQLRIDAPRGLDGSEFQKQFALTRGHEAVTDYSGTLSRAAEEARSRAAESGPTSLVDSNAEYQLQGLSEAFEGVEMPGASALLRARELMAQRDWAGALTILEELLVEQPDREDASVLAATCEHEMGGHELALKRLHVLLVERRSGSLADRLRERARDALTPEVYEEANEHVANGRVEVAVKRVETLITLDPRAASFHHLLAVLSMLVGAQDKAAAAIRTAVDVARPAEKPELLRMEAEILERLALAQMAQAVELFKREDYAAARRSLQELSEDVLHSEICRLFASYLKQCESGKAGEAASEDFKKAEKLYAYLLADETQAMRKALSEGDAEAAEEIGEFACRCLPQYPFAAFLYANAIYSRLGSQVASGDPPEFDDFIATLKLASKHAKRATQDPEILAAEDLASETEQLLGLVRKMKKDEEQARREAALVNPIIEKFAELMESPETTNVGSKEQLERVRGEFEGIRESVGKAKRKVKSEPALKALDDLRGVVDRHLGQVRSIEKEIDRHSKDASIVNRIGERLGAHIQQLNDSGGIGSASQADEVLSTLERLRAEARSARSKLQTDEGREALDETEKAIEKHLKDVGSMRRSIGEPALVNGLIQEFNDLMKPSSTGIHFGPDLSARVAKLKEDVARAKQKVTSRAGKKALSDLEAALRQLPF